MVAMRDVAWESCLIEPRPNPELEDRLTRETGRPGHLMRYLEGSTWLGDATIRLCVELSNRVHLDPDLADQAGLVVSQDNSCRFCFGAQRLFLRSLGMKEERIARLEQDQLTGDFTPRERAALQLARRVSRSAPLATEADLAELREVGFSNEEIVELVGLVGVHLYFNRLSTLAALPPGKVEDLPDKWWIRAARPLLAAKFRGMRKSAKPSFLSEAQTSGPYAGVVNGLDGLPMAVQFRAILDSMWASDVLGPRAVPLIFAIIARALGCEDSEREATRLLLEAGLSPDEIGHILTHLSSPALDELECEIVPLARETVWYEPSAIQRRCRDFRSRYSREQLLEFVGAVAVANAVCRLGVLHRFCA